MIKVISEPVSKPELAELAKEIGGFFIKVVADLEKGVIRAGAKMHVDEEQELLKSGCGCFLENYRR